MSDEIINSPSLEQRLNQCKQKVLLQPVNSEPLQLVRFDFWKAQFSPQDLDTSLGDSFWKKYMNSLLVPLFQKDPLYAQVNQIAGNPKFTPEVCRQDVLTKVTGTNLDTIFILLSQGQIQQSGSLVGDISIFGCNPSALYQKSLQPGVAGTPQEDSITSFQGFPESLTDTKCAYFNGIGIAEQFQGIGLGVYLLYLALKKLSTNNYGTLITRVIAQARNFKLMQRLGNQVVAWYSNPQLGNNYRAVLLGSVPEMLENISKELARKFTNSKELL